MRDVSMQAADLEEETDENIVEKCEELHLIAGSIAEREYAVRAFSSTNKLFSRWRNLHVYLTVFLFAMLNCACIAIAPGKASPPTCAFNATVFGTRLF